MRCNGISSNSERLEREDFRQKRDGQNNTAPLYLRLLCVTLHACVHTRCCAQRCTSVTLAGFSSFVEIEKEPLLIKKKARSISYRLNGNKTTSAFSSTYVLCCSSLSCMGPALQCVYSGRMFREWKLFQRRQRKK